MERQMRRTHILAALLGATALTLTACGGGVSTPDSEVKADANSATKSEAKSDANSATKSGKTTTVSIDDVLAHPRRAEEAKRDKFRNPKGTNEFFGIGPGKRVGELWPGWYTNVNAPYLAANDGQFVAILYASGVSEGLDKRIAGYKEKYSDTAVYGEIEYGSFWQDSGSILSDDQEKLDILVTYRNVHNWMGRDYAQDAFDRFYDALKPGGILGVVEHRLPETAVQDPKGGTGYVQESYMKDLAKQAGFEFVASSEVNANPLDSADHPFGVWTLQPRSRTPEEGSEAAKDFNADAYFNIGESDRATLKFRKPQ